MSRLNPEQVNALLQEGQFKAPVYLIGAGGCGMSGLGHLLLDLGHPVAGSDIIVNEETRQLCARGATIHQGHSAEHLSAAKPALVVYSSAIHKDNPELAAAESGDIPITRRAVLLAALQNRQRGICVAGMHGKTTTASMLAFALEQLGAHPSYAIGGLVPQLSHHACWSDPGVPAMERPWFVVEADESDGSLREFSPLHAIVLNVDEEHLDYFDGLEGICREFEFFSGRTQDLLVYCCDDPRLRGLFATRPRSVSFGYHADSDYRIEARIGAEGSDSARKETMTGSRFQIWRGKESLGEFNIHLLGEKNTSNAVAVITLLLQIGYDASAIARSIQPFQGAARRQHELFRDEHFRIFDDYGHHPREISATLRALKSLGCQRLLVAFQPHRYTRTQHLLPQFATCFATADKLWLTDIYAASEEAIPGLSGASLAAAVRAQGQSAQYVGSLDELRSVVRAAMQPNDLVLFLGAGDITRIAHELADQLRSEQAARLDGMYKELTSMLDPGTLIRRDEPLSKHTTWRVGGPADLYIEPASEADLVQVLRFCHLRHLPFQLLGKGSNMLVRDGGIRGVVICLANAQFCRVDGDGCLLRCGAGARLREVVMEAKRRGLGGLEFLEGIPGTVGGALRMNAGAMGSSLFSVLERVRCMDDQGEIIERSASEIPVKYRDCSFFRNHIALEAILKGETAPPNTIEEKLTVNNQRRWKSQPAAPSAGCVFKNPETIPAGKLIDELGLKGIRVGGAMVSDVHANFIVNTGKATARDILNLIEWIQSKARSARGIELQTEVEIVGDEHVE